MEAPLEQARDAYAHYRWDDAYQQFRTARENGVLGVDDLVALADAAWWLGHNDESLTLSEEVYRRGSPTSGSSASTSPGCRTTHR